MGTGVYQAKNDNGKKSDLRKISELDIGEKVNVSLVKKISIEINDQKRQNKFLMFDKTFYRVKNWNLIRRETLIKITINSLRSNVVGEIFRRSRR